MGGAEESIDKSLEGCAIREVQEELGLTSDQYTLQPINITHNFIFGGNKSERSGQKGAYQVFLADASKVDEIPYSDELKGIYWMNKEEVFATVSFPDLKEIFEKAIKSGINSF